MTAAGAMERTGGSEAKASKPENETTKSKDQRTPTTDDNKGAPKKRRKVNHGE